MTWEFKQEPSELHRWRWQCVEPDTGSVLKISGTFFPTLYDCIKDAELNGYKPMEAPATRQL
ncbi:MAG: hypothetical protein JWN13_6909 [Betaproteobacteria bacterium]|jgi:hypothetical protein|nr:hypothetical protein [Betaproteobacteria bacterium]